MTGRMDGTGRNRSDQIGRYDIGLDVADDVICIYGCACIDRMWICSNGTCIRFVLCSFVRMLNNSFQK